MREGSGGFNMTCEVMKWVTIPQSDLVPRERWVPSKHNARTATSVDQLCDVFRWAVIDVDEALRNDALKRCVECKQPVRLHKARTDGMAAHFDHVTKNSTCSLSHSARS